MQGNSKYILSLSLSRSLSIYLFKFLKIKFISVTFIRERPENRQHQRPKHAAMIYTTV
jgi:hypothetical protein